MKNVIIGIHGLGNKPPEDVLYAWWLKSLKEGANRNGIDLGKFEFELVYWADILHPLPHDLQIADIDSPLYLEDPYMPAIHPKQTGSHSLRKKIAKYLEDKLTKLLLNDDYTINYKSITDSLIKRYFHDLEAYYAADESDGDFNPAVRDQIRGRLIESLRRHKKDRILLIAHSMGSIVAFDVLDMNPDLQVNTFVTIGSPLGLPVVIARIAQERKSKHSSTGKIKTPDNISNAWYNLADLEDKVAFDFKISDDYSKNRAGIIPVDQQVQNDYEYRRKRNPHKVYGYLRTRELVKIVHDFNRIKHENWFREAVNSIKLKFAVKKPPRELSPDAGLPRLMDSPPHYLPTSDPKVNTGMNRSATLELLENGEQIWDFVVIGGGATGLGVAVEASSRGYKTLLLEQHDLGKGTSSRSTKLVHGGVRYLQQGNIALVLEALNERAILRKNAPHLVHNIPFVVPIYDWWGGPFYGIGLRFYDLLAGRHGFGPSINLSPEEIKEKIPQIEMNDLRGGVQYHDGQFDDARLIINLAQTAADEGASILNYMAVTSILKEDGVASGVMAKDTFTGKEFTIRAKCVINATGIFTDSIRKIDDPECQPVMKTSRGVHIVLDKSFLGGNTAIMVPHTSDGRVLFGIPWLNRLVIGTTETEVDQPELEPTASREEIEFILTHAAKYLARDPRPEDIKSVFAGLRPLVTRGSEENTAAISREHQILISPSGLVTITGGKWTTYRLMAEETINKAITVAQLPMVPSQTKNLAIHGWEENATVFGMLAQYGVDAYGIEALIAENPGLGERLHDDLPITKAMVVWAAREEMACTVEDVLARRTRCLLLDARLSMEIAEKVAKLLASELGHDKKWIKEQVDQYRELALRYLPEKGA